MMLAAQVMRIICATVTRIDGSEPSYTGESGSNRLVVGGALDRLCCSLRQGARCRR